MEKLVRLTKALIYAVALLTLLAVVLPIAVWTKGLFIIAIVFGVFVWAIYTMLERRDWHRNWRQRAADWRNYK